VKAKVGIARDTVLYQHRQNLYHDTQLNLLLLLLLLLLLA